MARITKSRARKPLAEGRIVQSWGRDGISGETFSLSVEDHDNPSSRGTYVSLKFGRNEAFALVKWIAPFLATTVNPDPYGMTERKPAADALRELADMIEGKG